MFGTSIAEQNWPKEQRKRQAWEKKAQLMKIRRAFLKIQHT
jgi:hypothetical protein